MVVPSSQLEEELTIDNKIKPADPMMVKMIATQSKIFSRLRTSVGNRSTWRNQRSANNERM